MMESTFHRRWLLHRRGASVANLKVEGFFDESLRWINDKDTPPAPGPRAGSVERVGGQHKQHPHQTGRRGSCTRTETQSVHWGHTNKNQYDRPHRSLFPSLPFPCTHTLAHCTLTYTLLHTPTLFSLPRCQPPSCRGLVCQCIPQSHLLLRSRNDNQKQTPM